MQPVPMKIEQSSKRYVSRQTAGSYFIIVAGPGPVRTGINMQ